jgi:hypothetical protein
MRNYIVIFLLLSINVNAQYPLDIKADNTWCFGYGTNFQRPFGRSKLVFSNSSIDTFYSNHNGVWMNGTNNSLSDLNGNLLFYSNGYSIVDKNDKKLTGGDSINCCNDFFLDYYPNGQTILENIISLPFIDSADYNNSLFYIIHRPTEYYTNTIISSESRYTTLKYYNQDSIVVVEKDIPFLIDTLNYGEVTACRHANGRDWWLIQNEYNKKRYHKSIVSPYGISNVGNQTYGIKVPQHVGQTVFTPDGEKYIRAGLDEYGEPKYYVSIFDFDRETGQLSNQNYFEFVDSSISSLACGVAVSGNSRFLYLSAKTRIWQFDLEASDVLASKTTVADFDGFIDSISGIPFWTIFNWMQLGPDGKIYIAGGPTRFLHTIDNPDEGGIACNVNQHSVQLPSINAYSIPNFPNFRLGPIDGSISDSLGIDVINNIEDRLVNKNLPVQVYPNPAHDYITISNPQFLQAWVLELYDARGRIVINLKATGAFRSIDVHALSAGIYFYRVTNKDGEVGKGKIVKQ